MSLHRSAGSGLSPLSRLSDAQTRSISAENRTGEKVGGGLFEAPQDAALGSEQRDDRVEIVLPRLHGRQMIAIGLR